VTAGIRHPLLEACGVEHAFGTREGPGPVGCLRPRQVHGREVARVTPERELWPEQADAVVCAVPGVSVAVVTADCVPVLLAACDGTAVAAVHAGWRGLAAGVVERGVGALRELSRPGALTAVVGPHIGSGAYEVDDPVLEALRARYAGAVDRATRPTRRGHAWLDLGALARHALLCAGLSPERVGATGGCTHAEPRRFHSYRRDGAGAGRLVHAIATRPPGRRLDRGEPRA